MEIQRKGDVLTVTLDESCTIVDVEEHTELLRNALLESKVRRLEMNVAAMEEIDTAYLQLFLVAQSHMKKDGGDFLIRRSSACLTEALACYGLKL